MRIANDDQLRQAEAAIASLREGLSALRSDPRTTKAYQLLAQGPLDQIQQIENEIGAYLGVNDTARVVAPRPRSRAVALAWGVGASLCVGAVVAPFALDRYRETMGDQEIRMTQDLLYPIGPSDALGQSYVSVSTSFHVDPAIEDVDAGAGVRTDVAETTCAAGNGGACYTLGVRAERDGNVDVAREHYARGCDVGGNTRACYAAGRLALASATHDAAGYFAPACREGMTSACWQLARIEWRAGTSAELEAHLVSVCDATIPDSGDACDRLGILATRDRRIDEAVRLFDRACTLDAPGGCANYAHHVYNGIGVARDRERGLALYARGCDGGVSSACIAELAVRRVRAQQFGDGARETVARQACLRFGGDPVLCSGD